MPWAQLILVEDDPGKFDIPFWLKFFRRTHSDGELQVVEHLLDAVVLAEGDQDFAAAELPVPGLAALELLPHDAGGGAVGLGHLVPEPAPLELDGVTGGKLRSGAVEPNPADSNFRFAFWPWQFPEKMGSLAASLGLIAAENCRFSPFWEIAGTTGVTSESPWAGP
jgi:hypothetical protein